MRIALITLALAALIFIGSIVWIFTIKNGSEFKSTKVATEEKISNEATSLEILKSQWKTEERIKILEAKIDALNNKNSPIDELTSGDDLQRTNSNQSNTNTATGRLIIPISAKFLARIITKVNLILTKNTGIFGLYIFDTNTEYSTYIDSKSGITIIATRSLYANWLKNFRSINTSIFSINETESFIFPSFYVNPPRSDNIIRIVMQVEAQTLMISIPKAKYQEFKTLMSKK